ncbi:hypothetical protein [Candidatus Harpocratesius sp.]
MKTSEQSKELFFLLDQISKNKSSKQTTKKRKNNSQVSTSKIDEEKASFLKELEKRLILLYSE